MIQIMAYEKKDHGQSAKEKWQERIACVHIETSHVIFVWPLYRTMFCKLETMRHSLCLSYEISNCDATAISMAWSWWQFRHVCWHASLTLMLSKVIKICFSFFLIFLPEVKDQFLIWSHSFFQPINKFADPGVYSWLIFCGTRSSAPADKSL